MEATQLTDLILLIGTNPLPNFVVADYFLTQHAELRTIWLVHSRGNDFQAGTSAQADQLEEVLGYRYDNARHLTFERVPLQNVSDASGIHDDLQQYMYEKLSTRQGVHLNYTGGTKSMSTHVYLWLKHTLQLEDGACSYLDGRNFRIVKDYHGTEVSDLREKIRITSQELIQLHGFKRCNRETLVDFAEACRIFQERMLVNDSFKNLDGHVLESYIAGKLTQHLKDTGNIGQILQNWKIQKPDWGKNHFELDVILLNGYQLIGISCTTKHDNAPCKNKGFEIIHRTKQIGGDEAKAILVTGMKSDKANALQKELFYDTGASKENILVLGVHDFHNDLFIRKIQQFM